MEPELKDWLNSINFNKNNILDEDSQVLKILSNEQIDFIKQRLDTGGTK